MAELQPHRGVLVLVLGILGIVLCPPVGIASWIMGRHDLAEMDAGRMDLEGRGLTEAGKILGIIGTILLAGSFVLGGLVLVAAIVGAAAQ